jgi:hypothetical protein
MARGVAQAVEHPCSKCKALSSNSSTANTILKIRAEINDIETKKENTIQRNDETKSWFFEKISKIINP